jgi:hypothetical protein
LVVVVVVVVGDGLQECPGLGAGAGGVHGQEGLGSHLSPMALLLLARVHCNTHTQTRTR